MNRPVQFSGSTSKECSVTKLLSEGGKLHPYSTIVALLRHVRIPAPLSHAPASESFCTSMESLDK